MALNIKNPRVCALAKLAADRTGRTQASVMEEALERFLAERAQESGAAQRRLHERLGRLDLILAEFDALLSADDKAALRSELDGLYDPVTGLPR